MKGFGSLDGEFWLGLRVMQRLTKSGPHELAIVLREVDDGRTLFARYSRFDLEGEDFKLTLGEHSGTAGDPMSK